MLSVSDLLSRSLTCLLLTLTHSRTHSQTHALELTNFFSPHELTHSPRQGNSRTHSHERTNELARTNELTRTNSRERTDANSTTQQLSSRAARARERGRGGEGGGAVGLFRAMVGAWCRSRCDRLATVTHSGGTTTKATLLTAVQETEEASQQPHPRSEGQRVKCSQKFGVVHAQVHVRVVHAHVHT